MSASGGVGGGSGGGVAVKYGGKKLMLPPRGVFVVVVVVVADKDCGTPSGTSCRLPQSVRGGKIQARVAQTSSEYHPFKVAAA
ncbi:MAG: hypothetical protein J0L63_20775, partial [Anaerolineae bacterium]|nr:hypothetical protein [Anaerolineae bacterium]